MNQKQAFEILGMVRFEGVNHLKAQFRQLAHLYHPDKNPEPEAELKFRQILEAYEFLLNHISSLYQDYGLDQDDEVEVTARTAIENLNDIFDDLFGFSRSGRVLGYHEPQTVLLSITEFAQGCEKKQKLISYRSCPNCAGAGARRGALARVCSYCFGRGVASGDVRQVCSKCHGRGRQMTHACERCDGFGRLRQYEMQWIRFPVGMTPGQIYTLDSYDASKKVKSQVFVEPQPLRDPIFQIDNYNLLCEYHLDFTRHRDDIRMKLDTPFGKVDVTLPKEVCRNDVIRVVGKGFYKNSSRSERGDLLVVIRHRSSTFFGRLQDWLRDGGRET